MTGAPAAPAASAQLPKSSSLPVELGDHPRLGLGTRPLYFLGLPQRLCDRKRILLNPEGVEWKLEAGGVDEKRVSLYRLKVIRYGIVPQWPQEEMLAHIDGEQGDFLLDLYEFLDGSKGRFSEIASAPGEWHLEKLEFGGRRDLQPHPLVCHPDAPSEVGEGGPLSASSPEHRTTSTRTSDNKFTPHPLLDEDSLKIIRESSNLTDIECGTSSGDATSRNNSSSSCFTFTLDVITKIVDNRAGWTRGHKLYHRRRDHLHDPSVVLKGSFQYGGSSSSSTSNFGMQRQIFAQRGGGATREGSGGLTPSVGVVDSLNASAVSAIGGAGVVSSTTAHSRPRSVTSEEEAADLSERMWDLLDEDRLDVDADSETTLNTEQKLFHATYFENIVGILNHGLLPGPEAENIVARDGAISTICSRSRSASPTGTAGSRTPMLPAAQQQNYSPTEDQSLIYCAPSADKIQGLPRKPDVLIEIDASMLRNKKIRKGKLTDTIGISGSIAAGMLKNVVPVLPGDLPDELKAAIVNPFDFDAVPILDFSLPKEELLPLLKTAASEIGFFYLVNHNVGSDLMDAVFANARDFFDLEMETKQKYLMDGEGAMIGYFGKGMENLHEVYDDTAEASASSPIHSTSSTPASVPKKIDCKEGFDMVGNVDATKSARNAAASSARRWLSEESTSLPDAEIPRFTETMRAYQKEVLQLSLDLMQFLGEALDLKDRSSRKANTDESDNILRTSCDDAVCHHRILHYPPLVDYKNEVSIGAHVDYGFLTLLAQDMTGGLQVLNAKQKVWVHVPPIKHAFVVNFGSMLAQWTSHRIKATVHRVVNLSSADRYSSPFFFRPGLNTVLDPRVFEGRKEEGNEVAAPTCEEILTKFYKRTGQAK